jgi:hypothetical protein
LGRGGGGVEVDFISDDIFVYRSCMKKVAKGQEKNVYEVAALKTIGEKKM